MMSIPLSPPASSAAFGSGIQTHFVVSEKRKKAEGDVLSCLRPSR